MTAVSVTITIFAVFLAGVSAGVIGLVTVAVHREEHTQTLTGPAPDRTTYAARRLNGVHVRKPLRAEDAGIEATRR